MVSRKDPKVYLEYLKIYKAIQNPVIFFTDHNEMAREMLQIRVNLSTQVNRIVW